MIQTARSAGLAALVALVAGLVAGAATAQAPSVAADQIAWAPSLAAAKAEAAKRGTSVLVALNIGTASTDRDTRMANLRMATDVYRDKRVVSATRHFVCLVASPAVGAGEDGNSTFGRITCEAQRAAWKEVLDALFPGESDIITPQHVLVDAKGKVVERILMERKADAFVEFLSKARKRTAGKPSAGAAKSDDDGSAAKTRKKKRKADPREVRRVVKLLKSKEPDIRESAFEQAINLLEIEPANKKLQSGAKRYLGSLGRRNMRGAFRTLAGATHEGALLLVAPYLTSRIDRIRDAVFGAFERGDVAESLVKPLAGAIKRTKDERNLVSLAKTFSRYVPEFPKNKKVFNALNKLAKSEHASVQAIALFGGAHENNKAIRTTLLARAKKGKTVDVREAAILGLGKANVETAIPVLEKLAEATMSERIRTAIARALAVLNAQDAEALKKARESLDKAGRKLVSSIRGPERERRRRRDDGDADDDDRRGRGDGRGGGGRGGGGRGGGRGGRR